jgi:hypothetical protein
MMMYDPVLFVVAIVIAHVLAAAALYLRSALRRVTPRPGRSLAWVALGLGGMPLPSTRLALLLCALVALILGLTLVAATVHIG